MGFGGRGGGTGKATASDGPGAGGLGGGHTSRLGALMRWFSKPETKLFTLCIFEVGGFLANLGGGGRPGGGGTAGALRAGLFLLNTTAGWPLFWVHGSVRTYLILRRAAHADAAHAAGLNSWKNGRQRVFDSSLGLPG